MIEFYDPEAQQWKTSRFPWLPEDIDWLNEAVGWQMYRTVAVAA